MPTTGGGGGGGGGGVGGGVLLNDKTPTTASSEEKGNQRVKWKGNWKTKLAKNTKGLRGKCMHHRSTKGLRRKGTTP